MDHFLDEPHGRALIAGVVDLENADPGAVIDRCELIQAPARARNPLEELHVQLQPVPRLRLLVTLPACAVRPVLLIGREPRHAVPRQDAVHRGHRDRDLVEARQVRRDATCAEVVVLPQVEDLVDHLSRRRARRAMRRPRTIAQADVPVLDAPPFPFVERLARNPEPPAHAGDVSIVGRLL
jgi:hypothetical protein